MVCYRLFKKQIFSWIFVLLFFVSGCTSTNVTPYAETYSPTNPDSIKIFRAFPPQPFIKIGEIELNSNISKTAIWLGDGHDKKLKEAAAKIGADAVVLIADEAKSSTAATYNSTSNVDSFGNVQTAGSLNNGQQLGRKMFAIAIKYKKDGENIQ